MKKENSYIKEYYDTFGKELSDYGINDRHLRIRDWLIQIGLNSGFNVLEIGCGPGTVSQLILEQIPLGHLVSVDISSESIKLAQKRLANFRNVEFHVSDMSDFSTDRMFDLVVMPDVLEHIPIDQHHDLFVKVAQVLKPGAKVFIHIPDPDFVEYFHEYEPKIAQVIDQAIHTPILLGNIEGTGLKLTMLQTYSIFRDSPDYQAIVLEKFMKRSRYELLNPKPTFLQKVKFKLKQLLSR